MSNTGGRRRWDWLGTPPGASEHQFFWSTAARDPLTDLCARPSLLGRLEESLARPRPDGEHLALVLCSLENFDELASSLGERGTDSLLVAASKRLRGAVRSHDIIARWDAGEFAVLADWLPHERVVTSLAMRIKDALTGSYATSVSAAEVDACVAAVVGRPEHTVETLVSETLGALSFSRRESASL
ncbi:MAG: diguanylate cyclase domain-containing protein [Actinomycetota bacterium]